MKDKKITNFALNLDEKTNSQFYDCLKEDFVVAGTLMPDAHAGYVAPIGSVLKTINFIVPSWVGYDIGCGMIAVKFNAKNLQNKIKENANDIHKVIEKIIPQGMGIYNNIQNLTSKTISEYDNIVEKFQKNPHRKDVLQIINQIGLKNLGTLGSGNHFIELGFADLNKCDDEVWLIIHSGSRKVGHTIASKYMTVAAGENKAVERTYPLDVKSNEGQEYLNALNFCLDYALLNRLEMAYKVHLALENFFNEKIEFELWTNKNHNHVIEEEVNHFIHRKGATPAKTGERGVIPGNMKDGSFLVEGLGNDDFLMSSSHGAGRVLSRKQAKSNISIEEFKESMSGIVANTYSKFIDEAPQAYKNIYDVMDMQKTSVKIIDHIKPIINWKG